jgi:hypothetical protein
MLTEIKQWSNDNSGFLSLITFFTALIIAWTSGFFQFLRHRPKFKTSIIPGPTFSCTYPTGVKHEEYDVTRTFFALYLQIANIGSAPASLETISLGYKWSVNRINKSFFKYVIGWCWLENSNVALEDFCSEFKTGDIKFYPFLIQLSTITMNGNDLYLPVGKSISGVIYFEQRDAWGACYPLNLNGKTLVKIKIKDTFGGVHCAKFKLPIVSLEDARKYNRRVGTTIDAIKD